MNFVLFREKSEIPNVLKKHKVIHCPAIKIVKKKYKLPKDDFDYLLLTSQNALRFVKTRPRVKVVVAIGKKTAQTISLKKGERLKVVHDSHAIGISDFFKKQKPGRILFLRGSMAKKLGDKNLLIRLRTAGHKVKVVETYSTKILSIRKPLLKILASKKIDGFFMTSPSTVEALRRSFSLKKMHSWPIKWMVIGPTTSSALRRILRIRAT